VICLNGQIPLPPNVFIYIICIQKYPDIDPKIGLEIKGVDNEPYVRLDDNGNNIPFLLLPYAKLKQPIYDIKKIDLQEKRRRMWEKEISIQEKKKKLHNFVNAMFSTPSFVDKSELEFLYGVRF